jgi:hypothetical protein
LTAFGADSEAKRSADEVTAELPSSRASVANAVLLGLAVWCVWRPVETFPTTAVLVASVVLGLAVWAWRRTSRRSNPWIIAAAAGSVLLASGVAGWDPASAVVEISLLAAVAALVWIASREVPPDHWPALLGLAISALTIWALWQVVGGMEKAASSVAALPEEMQSSATERLSSGRAFASQFLPSHLAVLFATALPILLARVRFRRSSLAWSIGAIACVLGLGLTRSPIGAALALAACALLVLRRRHRSLAWIALLMAVVLIVVVVSRGDVVKLKPVELRLDNWQTALWVWSGAPAAGVGVGGFAQAAQAIPFEVGNRPRHAHSLPLEALAELGPIGLVACAIALIALWRLCSRLWPSRPELAVAVAVIPAHNLLDFSLYGTGVAFAWAVLLGWAVACARPPTEESPAPAKGRAVFVAVVAVMLAVSVLHVTSVMVEESAVSQTAPAKRMDAAMRALHLAPWRVDPLGPVAAAALESADPSRIETALAALDDRRWLRPRSAAYAALRARLALILDRGPSAAAEAWVASYEQPPSAIHRSNLDALLGQLEAGGNDVAP